MHTPDLVILNGHAFMGGLLVFTGESQLSKTYNVAFSFEDFEAYLDVEGLQQAYENGETEGIDFEDHAQCIFDAWHRGGTGYEVQVSLQILKKFKFERKEGGFHLVCAKRIADPFKFQKKNNYKSFSPVLG
jgi:hypothetical protein